MKHQGLLIAACTAVLTVTACDRTGAPAPVVYGRTPPVGHQSGTSTTNPGTIVVQRGDTVHGIARRYRVPVQVLILANKLEAPYSLQIGQTITLPPSRQYVVQHGDTLFKIARQHQVPPAALIRANGLKAPFGVMVGQVLAMPETASTDTNAAAPPVTAARATPSSRHKVVSEPLPELPPPDQAVATEVAKPVEASVLVPETPPPPSAPPAETENNATVAVAVASPPLATASIPPPPARSGRAFLWPVSGKVVDYFGTQGEGLQNDGINIAAPKGTPVLAADNGVVVYTGNEIRGFGNLLLIKHSGGWMTAYAHHDTIAVHRGEKVKRGQVVGTVGNTGGVASPQLHFEVRRGTKPVDPTPYLESPKV